MQSNQTADFCTPENRSQGLYRLRFVLVVFWSLIYPPSLQAQAQTPTARPVDWKTRYQSAKRTFARFERQHGHVLKTANGPIHYLSWGAPSGVPLVWSHGSLTNAYELLAVADELVRAGYYLIAIDYYGHGQTPIPPHEVSLYHVADDIKSILDHLRIKKAVIGGWSRGGFISTAFYDAYPERTLGLILEDGGSVATNTYYHQMDSVSLANRVASIFTEWSPETTYPSEFAAYKALVDTTVDSDQFELLAWIRPTPDGRWAVGPGLLDLFHMKTPGQFLANIFRYTQVPLFAASMSLIEPRIIYRNLNVPMLILDPVSEGDVFPFEAGNKALASRHPRLIRHRIYPDTGHNIHYQRPKEFVADLAAFLRRVKAYHGW